ncbi:beta-ketoacyl synthase N-terminal-like domain-containing protein [Pseudoalteromonas sp. OOF1S-7]|uniref:beta-ketoacyl synthase N-terminal-like domain-containing protein n=1 Tax=Pseudoalteromonas sp. OOF1S-7 TaxID=2917757 RepID=UPI001EF49222|nr:beta-ketoacyl synthase N-terminal-like domain-containing protein [Pseudoalteromonas sp. OOF1S-7]MCG7536697.1 hypothetical protein [Pseudoalteromonas sp. OOF1S-7]
MHIVGLGAVSALGHGIDTLRELYNLAPMLPGKFAQEGALSDTVFYQGLLTEEQARSAWYLANEAITEALGKTKAEFNNIALIIATGAGDTKALEITKCAQYERYNLAQKLATEHGLKGLYLTVSNACSSSGYALPIAQKLLAQGHDAVVVCGVEAKSDSSQMAFKAMMALDDHSCRPFQASRNGTVLGAGAAALVLTHHTHVKHYAYIQKTTLNCDGYHVTAPNPEGKTLAKCLDHLMTEYTVSPCDVGLFLPHATGTQLNDGIEHALLKRVFPDTFTPDKTVCLKQWIGHTGGASAAFSYLSAALHLSGRFQVAKTNLARCALVNSTAFGGHNCMSFMTVNKEAS